MLTREFDYDLPAASIAQHPAPRGTSRLLVLDRRGSERHRRIRDLPQVLHPGDLLVVNNTRVLPARLYGRRAGTAGRIEILLAERVGERDWDALLRPGRKGRPGTRIVFGADLEAKVTAKGEDGRYRLRFSAPIEPHLERLGHMPLPPYIKRPDEPGDRQDYQTIFARHPGAIAAPTAGLHFTAELLDRLHRVGVRHTEITLHVGIGTFKPVTAMLVHEHHMDSERYEIAPQAAAAIRDARAGSGRVVAVGTTVVRALESSARRGQGSVVAGSALAEVFITPGFRFQVVDVLLTNFHLPRSTLLMLVCAFADRKRVLAAYQEAVRKGYRFYSYGDAMLAERASRLATTAAP